MKLYELSDQMLELENIDFSEYEDDDSLAEAIANSLKDVKEDFYGKLNVMVKMTLNNDAFSTACDNEIKRLQAHKKSLNSDNASIKNYILHEMQKLGKKSIKTGLFTLSDAKGRARVVIDKEDDIPLEYMVIKTTEAPDKKALLKALGEGEIKGCHVEDGDNSLRIT